MTAGTETGLIEKALTCRPSRMQVTAMRPHRRTPRYVRGAVKSLRHHANKLARGTNDQSFRSSSR